MSIDQKALMAAQDRWAKTWNEYRDISISTVIEYYEAAKSSEQPVGCREAFESAFSIKGYSMYRNDVGDYDTTVTCYAWFGWKELWGKEPKREMSELTSDERLEVINVIAKTIWPEAEWDGEQENANIAAIKVSQALIKQFKINRIEGGSE